MKNKYSVSYKRELRERSEAAYDVADAAFVRIADGGIHVQYEAWQIVRGWEWDDEFVSRVCAQLYRTGDRLSEMSQA